MLGKMRWITNTMNSSTLGHGIGSLYHEKVCLEIPASARKYQTQRK